MRQWLLSIVGTSMLSSLALALCPKGRVKQATRFVCALVCMLALVSPLIDLDAENLLPPVEDYLSEAQTIAAEEREMAENEQREYIQSECAAYILTEAQALGVSASEVTVLARWDAEGGVWQPAYATVDAPYHAGLSAAIETELGIAREAQRWQE